MRHIKAIGYILFLLNFFPTDLEAQKRSKTVDTSVNYVPDKATAIKIAEAIWLPIFGNEIYADTPFIATLNDSSVWIIEGTLHYYPQGGVPYIEVRKKDDKVLKVTHGK